MAALVFVASAAAAAGYLGLSWWAQNHPSPPTGPPLGEPLPATNVTLLGVTDGSAETLRDFTSATGRCSLVVLASVSCSYCRLMRATWPSRARLWVDSVGAEVERVWLSGDSEGDLQAFYEGFDFDDVTLLRVPEEPALALGRLGLFGTPTTYLLDRKGRLHFGVMGDRLPPVSEGQDACG